MSMSRALSSRKRLALSRRRFGSSELLAAVLGALAASASAASDWFGEPIGSGVTDGKINYTVLILIPAILLAVVALFWCWLQRQEAVRRAHQLQRELNERQRVETALRESEARFRDVT